MGIFDIAIGTTLSLTTSAKKNGLPFPMPSGTRVLFMAKTALNGPDSTAVAILDNLTLGGVVITDALNGVAQITMPPTATYSISPPVPRLYYEIWIKDASGNEWRTEVGTINLLSRGLVQQP